MTVEMNPLPSYLLDAWLANYKKAEDLIGQNGPTDGARLQGHQHPPAWARLKPGLKIAFRPVEAAFTTASVFHIARRRHFQLFLCCRCVVADLL